MRILRDTWGVPHIFGRRDVDVAYGLAWAHAEDDFETTQVSLLAARGTLAALRGRGAAANDYAVAWLRIPDTVEIGWTRDLTPETRALAEAYADGLNRYAAAHPGEVLASIYHSFGIEPTTIVYNHLNQPRELVKAEAVSRLFA